MEFVNSNFEVLTKKPEHIDHLKQLVLDLAFKGLLAPQKKEEGDALMVLKQIREYHNSLVENGAKKKKKTFPSIKEKEKHFGIPDTWKWVRLGEVYYSTSGGTPTRGVPEYWNGDIPWLKSGELNDGVVTELPGEYITKEGLRNTLPY